MCRYFLLFIVGLVVVVPTTSFAEDAVCSKLRESVRSLERSVAEYAAQHGRQSIGDSTLLDARRRFRAARCDD